MMKKKTRSSHDFKKLAALKQDRNVYKNRQAEDKVKPKKMDKASQSVNRKMKSKYWRFDDISRDYIEGAKAAVVEQPYAYDNQA